MPKLIKKILITTPLILFLIFIGISNSKYNSTEKNEIKIRVLKNKWEFSPNKITISKGEEWTLKIYNEDSYQHSFFVKELGVNKELMPKTETLIKIKSDESGKYSFYCTTICGEGHYRMNGQIEIR